MTGFAKQIVRSVAFACVSFVFGASALAQDLGGPTTTTFEGDGFSGGVIANPVTSGAFTYTFSDGPVLGDTDEGEGASAAVAGFGGTQNETLRIDYSGDNFDFNSFFFSNNASVVTLQVRGYNASSAQVATQTFTTSLGTQTLTVTDAGFNSVDHIIITGTSAFGFDNAFWDSFAFDAPSVADATAPRISSIVRQTPATASTNADSLVFRVTFDEAVQNVDTTDFTASGTSGTATGVSAQSTTVYDVTVSGGDLAGYTGAVSLGFAGGQNISDTPAGNALVNTTPTGANESYTVDNTAPAAPSTPDLDAGSDTGSSSTDNITNDTTPTFTGTAEANAIVTVSSSVSGSLGSTTADGAGNWSYTSGVLAEGAHTITATATDAASNASAASGGLSITIDTTAPDINSITRLSPTGQSIGTSTANAAFRVTYSEAVAGSSQTDYAFQNVSGTAAGSVSSYGTSSPTQINVQLGTLSGEGDFSVTLNGGHGITDIAGNALSSATPTGVREVFSRDGTAPSTTSFVRTTPAGATTSADSLVFTANYSESVSGVGVSDFVVTGSSATVQSVSAASGTSIAITVSGGDLATYNGTVGLDYAVAPTITDAAGNALPNTEPATDETYTLDNTAPSGYSVTLDQDPVNAGNQTTASFTFAGAEVGANYSYTITSSGGGVNVTGSGAVSSATQQVSVIDVSGLGDGTLTLSVTLTDGAGNAGSAATDTTTKEAQAPQVNSITISGSPAGNAASVDFSVTFSEAAQNISTDDFALTTTGSATGTIASVSSATGTTVTVTVNTISGDGTIRLDLSGATNIQDASGNAGPNAYTAGSVHTVDNTAPAAFGITWLPALVTGSNETAAPLRFTTAEVGTTYAYSVSSSGGGAPVTGTAAITNATQDVNINVSSLADGTLTATATLTDDAGNATSQTAPATVSKATATPGFSMAFSPASVLAGGTSTVTFTIDNSALGVSATSLDFTNNLPAGVTVATTPNASTTCTGGTLTAVASAGSVAYTGGSVAAGASCTVSVDVTPGTTGAFVNTTGVLTSNLGNSGTANATLTGTQPALSVNDPSVVEGDAGTVTLNFTVTLAPASPQTITVDYATSDGTATAGVDYTSAAGTLTFAPGDLTKTVSVTVASDADIEPDETIILTLSNQANATISDATGTGTITTDDIAVVDNTPPTLQTISRLQPADALTNADSLTWDLVFSESVRSVSAADFTVTGPDGVSLSIIGSATTYQATASGAGLVDYNGAVGLELAAGASIRDQAGNDLAGGTPAGAEAYELDNTGPVPTLATEETAVFDVFTVTISFDEAVTGFELSDLDVQNASVSGLNSLSASSFSFEVTPPASGGFSISLPAGTVSDALGNPNAASNLLELEVDASHPVVASITASTGLVTNADTLVWEIEFSEPVTGVDRSSISVTGLASPGVGVEGSGAQYTVTVRGGGLQFLNGEVSISVPASPSIEDRSGLPYQGEGPTGEDQSTVRVDNTRPTPTLSTASEAYSTEFELTISFNESVQDLSLAGLSVTGGEASNLQRVDGRTFTATITPSTYGQITMTLNDRAARDLAGNESPASSSLGVISVASVAPVATTVNIDTGSPVGLEFRTTLNNPTGQTITYSAQSNADWLNIQNPNGSMAAHSQSEITYVLNQRTSNLPLGQHTSEIQVFAIGGGLGGGSGSSGVSGTASASSPQAEGDVLIATIPVTLILTSDGGSVQLVSTTPSGLSGDVDVSFTSSAVEFDGVELSTVNGYAETAAEDVDSGLINVRQSLPAGWRVDSIQCVGDADNGSQVDLATGTLQIDVDSGETLVCTFANVRDEDVVRLATQRAIRNFMFRRADRIIDAAPDLSMRLSARENTGAGQYAADVDQGRYSMSLTASLAGARNQAKARHSDAPGVPSHMRDNVGRFDVWLSAELAGVNDNRAGERAESDFGVAQFGADWEVSDELLVGGMIQFDWMDETAREVFEEAGAIAGARVDGEGWMAGPYVVWRMADRIVLDGLAMYGSSTNTINPLGLYEDEFETDRWMVRANLTGEYGQGGFLVRPQATLTHFEETQDGYTDSLGIVIPSQSIALGRLSAGPEFVWRQDRSGGAYWELRSRLRAVWDYQPAELLMESGLFSSSESEFRADGEVGLAATMRNGAQIEFSLGLSGIGQDDFEANTARFNLRFPLSLGQ
ncbi:Ig-like domain-containing protein [Oceanicaulis sp. LC35]|uniref:DUF7933 domain-containing protein n=1 Tax=Oceanicaulis sp. LC35 TaxID=3349635 RepID=UPI003F837A65